MCPKCYFRDYTKPKKALENAISYKSNNFSWGGSSISFEGRGSFKEFEHVLLVGMKEVATSTNSSFGFSANPKTGSSSAPVVNRKMSDKFTQLRVPPIIKTNALLVC
jgi:hypothetical protein